MERRVLAELVELGLTQRQLADRLGCSQSTVRYWLRRWDLRTRPATAASAARDARVAGFAEIERDCKTHGPSRFVLDAEGIYRCARCRSDRVAARRRRVKAQLVAEAGGRCALCGYSRHPAALQFHHLDPTQKRFGLGAAGLSRGIERMRAEASKCILLCSNCHAELEVGFAALPPDVESSRG